MNTKDIDITMSPDALELLLSYNPYRSLGSAIELIAQRYACLLSDGPRVMELFSGEEVRYLIQFLRKPGFTATEIEDLALRIEEKVQRDIRKGGADAVPATAEAMVVKLDALTIGEKLALFELLERAQGVH